MKIIKSDHRYKYHSSGFVHILEYKTTLSDRAAFQKMLKAVEDVHGPYLTWRQNGSWGYDQPNDNFRVDYSRKLKRRRIYLKSEQELTFFLLKGQV